MKHTSWGISLLIGTLIGIHSSVSAQDIDIHFTFIDESTAPGDTLSPYLQIEYINNSSHCYYFPSLASFDSPLPRYATSLLICYDEYHGLETTLKDFERCHDCLHKEKEFQGQHYYLPLDFLWSRDEAWNLVTEDDFTSGESYEEDLINNNLFGYADFRHNIGQARDNLGAGDTKSILRSPKKLRRAPFLVFLEGHERMVQLLSLSGISDTGITLTVCLKSNFPPRDFNVGLSIKDTMKLPRKVYKYQLYERKVESNVITKEF